MEKNPIKSRPKRLCCEFNNCKCIKYSGKKYGQCNICNHGAVWHKLVHIYKGTILSQPYMESNMKDVPH